MTRAERAYLTLAAVAVVAVYLAQRAPPGARFAPYLLGHAALLVASLVACRAVARDVTPARALRRALWAGVAVRVALIPVAPFTTTDVGRYLWDGAVLLSGNDPYALTPDDPSLIAVRAVVPLPADHRDVATCYPPLALALFALAARAGAHALLAWKLLCALASTLAAVIVARESERVGRGEAPLALLGPIAVLEAGVGAHLESFVALAAVVMVTAARRDRWDRAALAAGTLIALKLAPGVLALPALLRAPRPVRFAAIASVPFSVTFGAAELARLSAPGSLPNFARHWSFGSPVWAALYARFPWSDDVIRPAMALLGLLAITLIALRRKDIARDTAAAAGVSLAASPVLYPWYGASLAALLPLAPSRWALLSLAALPTSYEVIDGFQRAHRWAPARWPMTLLAAAALAGLALDARARRRAR